MTDEQEKRLQSIRAYNQLSYAVSEDNRVAAGLLRDARKDIDFLLSLVDSQVASSDLKERDDVLAFFGASLKENGDLHIDMKKYHAAHLCPKHSFEPWRRSEIKEKCVICLAHDQENAVTLMHSACIKKLTITRDHWSRQVIDAYNSGNESLYKELRTMARTADELIAIIKSVTIQEQEKQK